MNLCIHLNVRVCSLTLYLVIIIVYWIHKIKQFILVEYIINIELLLGLVGHCQTLLEKVSQYKSSTIQTKCSVGTLHYIKHL
jgi:hypothetical protein